MHGPGLCVQANSGSGLEPAPKAATKGRTDSAIVRVSSRTALRLTLGGCRGRDLIQTGNTMNDENENTNAPDPATSSEATGDENTLPAKWTPGMASPNPAGRPKMPKSVKEVKLLAREHTPMAISTLAKIAANPKSPPASRVAACESLLARGWGRAPTTDLEAAEGLIVQILKFNNPQLDDDNMKTIEGSVEPDDAN